MHSRCRHRQTLSWQIFGHNQRQRGGEMKPMYSNCKQKRKREQTSYSQKRRADEVRMAQNEIDKEFKIKEMELQAQQAQAQANTSPEATPPPGNKDAKSLKLPSFIDEKDELESYLLSL